eukprot:gene16338-19434_t
MAAADPAICQVYGGRDLVHGGTWLGINDKGSFGVLLNYRINTPVDEHLKSRGLILSDFLKCNIDPKDFAYRLKADQGQYGTFSVILGNVAKKVAYYFCNGLDIKDNEPMLLEPNTIHGVSNGHIHASWQKGIYLEL